VPFLIRTTACCEGLSRVSVGIVSRCDAPNTSACDYRIDRFVEAVAAAPLFHFDAARMSLA
jgi:hypothetical protein